MHKEVAVRKSGCFLESNFRFSSEMYQWLIRPQLNYDIAVTICIVFTVCWFAFEKSQPPLLAFFKLQLSVGFVEYITWQNECLKI